MPNKISASYLLFNWPPGPIDIAVTIAGFALALAGFLLRRTELEKPEAERDGGRVRLGTTLLVVGGCCCSYGACSSRIFWLAFCSMCENKIK
jgi:hypothetical protein